MLPDFLLLLLLFLLELLFCDVSLNPLLQLLDLPPRCAVATKEAARQRMMVMVRCVSIRVIISYYY